MPPPTLLQQTRRPTADLVRHAAFFLDDDDDDDDDTLFFTTGQPFVASSWTYCASSDFDDDVPFFFPSFLVSICHHSLV